MVTAASAVRPLSTLPVPLPPVPIPRPTLPYGFDWRPHSTPGTQSPATPPPLSRTDTARAQEAALLAADVYNDPPTPPAGFRVADRDDLDALGLTQAQLEQPGSSFRARVYVTGSGDDTRYVVAFRGSTSGEDWRNNFEQGTGNPSESYNKALAIGQRLARSDAEVTLTGHSLGGGLASAASIASGRPADTFNAAGLHEDTIRTARTIARAEGRGGATVEAWHVRGEILTAVQEGSDGWLDGRADLPDAYGTARELPFVVPEGRNWFQAHSPVNRHGIDWVLAGAAALSN
jgi:hypothetical protein